MSRNERSTSLLSSGENAYGPPTVIALGVFKAYYLLSKLIKRDDLPIRPSTRTMIVRSRTVVAEDQDVVALVLEAPDGSVLPSWRPGAHLDVILPSGRQRQYSLCGDPRDASQYRIAVRRVADGDGGSIEIHDTLTVGSTIEIKGPRNAFPIAMPGYGVPEHHVHLIAGGIGITPILAMARLAHELGIDWSMVYTGRSRDSIPFLEEIAEFGDRVTLRFDDEQGLPHTDDLLANSADGTIVYCCGPAPMLDAINKALETRPGIGLHFERFAPPPIVDGKPFQLQLASTGQVIDVSDEESALSALTAIHPETLFSCRQGFCGMCEVPVVEGAVDHCGAFAGGTYRDGRERMRTCVDRAPRDSRVIVDL